MSLESLRGKRIMIADSFDTWKTAKRRFARPFGFEVVDVGIGLPWGDDLKEYMDSHNLQGAIVHTFRSGTAKREVCIIQNAVQEGVKVVIVDCVVLANALGRNYADNIGVPIVARHDLEQSVGDALASLAELFENN